MTLECSCADSHPILCPFHAGRALARRERGEAFAYAYGRLSMLLDLHLRGLVADETARRMFEEIKAELEEGV